MLLTEEEVQGRIESPLNLLNRLRRASSSNSNSNQKTSILSLPPSAEEVLKDLDEKLRLPETETTRTKATALLNNCLDELGLRLPEISKPEKLADVAEKMSKIVNAPSVRAEKGNNSAQIVIYSPQTYHESHFETIHVSE